MTSGADHRHTHDGLHQPPRDCPVCGETLTVTRLGCESCGTELSGRFAGCAYCALDPQDRSVLAVFLTSRGNMREVAKWLDVSYPTARQRFAELLSRLGLSQEEATADAPAPAPVDREEVLRRLASGEIDLDEASTLLGRS